jgi:type II secretion system protein N
MIPLAIPERLRRPLKWVGYPLFAAAAFLLALYLTLPRDRIKDRLEADVALFLGHDVTAGDFGLTLLTGPGVTAAPVTVKTRPTMPGDKPQRYVVDELTVHLSLWQLSRGFADTRFSGRVAGGAFSGKYRSVPDEAVLALDLSGVSLKDLPGLAQGANGIPITGSAELKVDVVAPKNLMAQAAGSAAVTVENCVVGDGKAKLVVPGDPMLAAGITVPKLSFGRIAGSVVIDKGRATFRDLRGHSKEADVELMGYVELRDPLSLSLVHAYLKFKPSDALVKREPTIEMLNTMLGNVARRPDGFLGFSITGTVSSPLFLPSKEPPQGVTAHASAAPPPGDGPGRAGAGYRPVPSAQPPSAPPPSAPRPSAPPPSPVEMPAHPPSTAYEVPAPPPPPSSEPTGQPPPIEAPANAIPPAPALRHSTRGLLEGAARVPPPTEGEVPTVEVPIQ